MRFKVVDTKYDVVATDEFYPKKYEFFIDTLGYLAVWDHDTNDWYQDYEGRFKLKYEGEE